MLPIMMTATYLTVYGILPFYLNWRKRILSVVLIVLLQLFIILDQRVALSLLYGIPYSYNAWFGITTGYHLLENNLVIGTVFAIKIYKMWHEQQEEKQETVKRHLGNELLFLKAQLHPHFLFNTMNNLYALSLANKTKTTGGIAKIVELLHSVLCECNEWEIPIEREIGEVKKYFELEGMRHGERLKVNFDVDGEIRNFIIAPLILFTFIENCFKHGSSADLDNPYVYIDIKLRNSQLSFETNNSRPQHKPKNFSEKEGGVELQNVRKRLEILNPGNYKLNCVGDADCYNVSFTLKQ